jgi:hypothetical protein
MREGPITNAGDPEDEAEQVVLRVERSGSESADVVDDVQQRRWDDLALLKPPDVTLEIDASVTVLVRAERANANIRGDRFSSERRGPE